jgi:hypothetical protein
VNAHGLERSRGHDPLGQIQTDRQGVDGLDRFSFPRYAFDSGT